MYNVSLTDAVPLRPACASAPLLLQASQAVLRAWEDGVRWQCLELPLPLNNAPAEGGWPGGIRQQVRPSVAATVGAGLSVGTRCCRWSAAACGEWWR